jgi:hypothetical protein
MDAALVAKLMLGLIPTLLGVWTILAATVFHDRQVAACRRLLEDNLISVRRRGVEWKLRMLESPEQRKLSICGGIAAIILGMLVAVFLPI